MSDTAITNTLAAPVAQGTLARVLREGYGPGAWHGADLRAAIDGVNASQAFWRPGAGRHNIAEIAVHHAFYVRSVAGRLTGRDEPAFPLQGDDWFEINDERTTSWTDIKALLERLQERLAAVVEDVQTGRVKSPMEAPEQLDVVLGITCHAIYHAGQVQLIKVLQAHS